MSLLSGLNILGNTSSVVSSVTKRLDRQTPDVLSRYRIEQIFNNPLSQNFFFNNLDYLLSNATYNKFEKNQWYYNPQLFSLEIYGNTLYTRIVLLANKTGTQFEFHPDYLGRRIVTPSSDSIRLLIRNNNVNI